MISTTPAAVRRQRRRADRRDAMLDAALAIVMEHGLESLTIARLATQLDMATGAMYRYFSSKTGLVAALQQREVLALSADLAKEGDAAVSLSQIDEPGERALIRVFAIARGYLRLATQQPQRHRLVDAIMSTRNNLLDRTGTQQMADVVEALLEQVSVPLADAAAAGVIRPGNAQSRTYILWAAVHGFDHLRKRDRSQPAHLRAAVLIQTASVDLLRGWGATELVIERVIQALHLS